MSKKEPEWIRALREKADSPVESEREKSEKIDLNIINIPPFSFIKEQEFAYKLDEIKPDESLIEENQEVIDLSIIISGIVSIGEKRKGYWIERTSVKTGSVLGELEVPIQFSIHDYKYLFEGDTASQSAWPSSEALKWYGAYTDQERKQSGKRVILLKILRDSIKDLMANQEFKEWVLFDQFRKMRSYLLDIDEIVQKSKGKTDEHYVSLELAYRCLELYKRRKAVGCSINDNVYIFGKKRFLTLLGTTETSIAEINKQADKIQLFIDEQSADKFIDNLSEDKQKVFLKTGTNFKFRNNMVGRVLISKGSQIYCLQKINHE